MTRRFLCWVLAATPLCVGARAFALEVGDPAPPISITDWVKGKPIDVLKDGKGKIIMLDFWATWCGPCVQMIPDTNALYQKYKDQGLILVAITDMGRGQTLSMVRDFVSREGSKMDYPVAFDGTQRTTMTYQAFSLPHAVLIDREGKIAWIGHPAMPDMRSAIDDLLHDRFDAKAAARVAQINAMLSQMANELYMDMQQSKFEDALAVTDRMLQADPGNFDAMQYRVLLYIEHLKSIDRMRDWVTQYIEQNKSDAEALSRIAQLMMAIPDITQRQPDLALEASRMALAAKPKSREVTQAAALTFFEVGDLDAALRYQQKAVGLAQDPDSVNDAKAVLAFLEKCDMLRKSPQASAPK